jgi:hypothetical protein
LVLCLRKAAGAFTKLEPRWDEAEQEDGEQQGSIDHYPPHRGSSLDRFRLPLFVHGNSLMVIPSEE